MPFKDVIGLAYLAANYLALDASNQASWTPTTTKVTNLNSDLIDGVHLASLTSGRLLRYNSTGTQIESATVTELSGALGGITTLSMSNQLTNTLADGTAPFLITSTTVCTNLNADKADGYDFNQDLRTSASPQFAGLTVGASGVVNPLPGVVEPVYAGRDSAIAYLGCGSFGDAADIFSAFFLAKGRGTHAVPAAVLSGDLLGAIYFVGQIDATVGNVTQGCQVYGQTTENWSTGNCGAELQFWTNPNASAVGVKRWTIEDDGTLLANGAMAISTTGAMTAGSYVGADRYAFFLSC